MSAASPLSILLSLQLLCEVLEINMMIQPLILFGDSITPNPHKVRIVLDELALPYTESVVPFNLVKEGSYTRVNPNGRLPTLHDPNTGVTVWESIAILLYLVDTYDKNHLLTYDGPQKYEIIQWLLFQASGQGPYYGQYVWFQAEHEKVLPSAMVRYQKEIERVRAVLDGVLATKGNCAWLVGDKCTIADLAWVMWESVIDQIYAWKGTEETRFPAYQDWIQRLYGRQACARAMQSKDAAMEESGFLEVMRSKILERDSLNPAS